MADQWSALRQRRDAVPIVGATCGRLTESDQMEAAKGSPYGVGEWLASGRG